MGIKKFKDLERGHFLWFITPNPNTLQPEAQFMVVDDVIPLPEKDYVNIIAYRTSKEILDKFHDHNKIPRITLKRIRKEDTSVIALLNSLPVPFFTTANECRQFALSRR